VETVRLSGEAIEAVVLPEVGARLHRLRVFGHDLLRMPGDVDEHLRDPFFWGSFVMAPWCNRIAAGELLLGSRRVVPGSNFADGSAIHGQVYARPWERDADGTLWAVGGGDGWPWVYVVSQRIELRDRSLRLRLSLVNRSTDAMPAGLGIHPWFRRPVQVAIRGATVHASNEATEPRPVAVHDQFDLREVGEMPPDLDATWTDLAEPPVELRWPVVGIRAVMRIIAPQTIHVVGASPGNLDAIAVEPQTHAPQGLRRLVNGEPGALAWLEPGAALGLTVELAFDRFRPA
jgi:aldose 1-epimerase